MSLILRQIAITQRFIDNTDSHTDKTESDMKKLFIISALAWLAATPGHAEDYGYVVFEHSGGTVQAVQAMGLKITFADGQLTATPATGEPLTVSLADMAAMRFATEAPTGIGSIEAGARVAASGRRITVTLGAHAHATVATPSGMAVARFCTAAAGAEFTTHALESGVYIVKTDSTTTKILVR